MADDWTKRHPERHRANVARWRAANPEKTRASSIASHLRNKEKRNDFSRHYRAANLARIKAMQSTWSKTSPEAWRVTNAARRAARKQAIPLWAAEEFDKFVVAENYDLAIKRSQRTGLVWHVDHEVPLQSPIVCGLHCAANLRVVLAFENHSKGNRRWLNMPCV